MYPIDFVKAALRRWYLIVLVLALAVAAAAFGARLAGTKHTAVATFVLIPPETTVQEATRTASYAPPNPLLYLGGLTQSRDVLLRTMTSQETAEIVSKQAATASFDVAADPQSSGPIIILTTQSKSGDEALSALTVLSTRLQELLTGLQQQLEIADQNRITIVRLTADTQTEVDSKSQMQLAGAAFVFVAAGGLMLVALLDAAISRRKRRGADTGADDDAADEVTTPRVPMRRRLGRSSPEEGPSAPSHDGDPSGSTDDGTATNPTRPEPAPLPRG